MTRTDHLSTEGFGIRSYVGLGNPNTQHVQVEVRAPGAAGTPNLYTKGYFDGFGRTYRTRKKGPAGLDILQDMTYNPRGLVSSQTAPYYSNTVDTYTTTYSYDSLDRLTVTDFPDSNQTSRTYQVWKETTTDEHGHATTSTFDAYGRRILMEQTAVSPPVETHYGYDLLGRMIGMTDHVGNDWSWTFDSLGRNTSKTDPDAGSWTFTYDDSGLLDSQLDAKNQTTSFTYDAAARLATKTTPGETVTMTRSEPRTGYFNVGRVTTITTSAPPSPPKVLAVDYDALGRPVKQARTIEGPTYTAQKQYDAGGFLSTITYPDTETVGPMQYDAAGRLSSIPGYVSSVSYDAAGRPLQQANINGTTTTRTYSPERGFLTGIVTTGPGGPIQNLSYTPDGAGMVTQVTSPSPNESWTYGYDPLHRLTSASGDQSQTFTYDSIGRITYNSLVGTYTYPPDGQPRPHAPDTVNGGAMLYDLNGNLTSGRTRTITWNPDNLPSQISVASPSITTQFTYDGLGERLKAVATWATGSATSIYPMGDDFEIADGVITKHISVDGLGVVAKRRVILQPLTIAKFWLHTDRLGSIQAITDASGAEVQRRTYRPYGQKMIADSTSHWEPRGWIDQRTDVTTELTYLHARYYDPALGLFISPDPLHPAVPGVGSNRYAYGYGNPITYRDRTGLSVADCWTDAYGNVHCPGEWVDVPGEGPGGTPGNGAWPGRGGEEEIECSPGTCDTGDEDGGGNLPPNETCPGGSNCPEVCAASAGDCGATGKPEEKPKKHKPQTAAEKLVCKILGDGYLDMNFSAPLVVSPKGLFGAGVTFGINITQEGVNFYGGAAAMVLPGPSLSVQRSGSSPSPGLNLGLQMAPIPGVSPSGQVGHGALGRGSNLFGEGGLSFGTPGFGLSAYWVSQTVRGSNKVLDCK